MKKRLISIVSIFVLMLSLVACGKEEVSGDIKIASLKGPTSMGLAKLYDDADNGKLKNNYDYSIVNSPDEIVAGLSKGDFDVAAVPANLGAVLYNKSEGKLLKVANINTLGVLYLASGDESIKGISDLKGKEIVLSGKGATPEYVLRYLLKENNIDPDNDVNLVFKSEHTEVLQSLVKNGDAVVMLPEPFLSIAKKQTEIKNIISLNDLWNESFSEDLITGVIVVRNEFLKDENNKLAFDMFLKDYENSVEFVNNNIEESAKLIGKYDIVKEEIAKDAIENSNIVFIDGKDMKDKLKSYYEILFNEDAKSIGGQIPDDEIYYEK